MRDEKIETSEFRMTKLVFFPHRYAQQIGKIYIELERM